MSKDAVPPAREPSLRTLAMPGDANPNGDIFGGWLMSQMDLAGGIHAYDIAKGRVATVAVDAMSFDRPVRVGDALSIYCETRRIGTTSIAINIETWVRRAGDGGHEQVTEGLFTFVAIDDDGKPRPVPRDPSSKILSWGRPRKKKAVAKSKTKKKTAKKTKARKVARSATSASKKTSRKKSPRKSRGATARASG